MDADGLRRELALLGMTQRQLAALGDVTEVAVSYWCTGSRPVPGWVPRMLRLWRALPDRQRVRVLSEMRAGSKKPPA